MTTELKPLVVSPSWLGLFQDCEMKHHFKYDLGLGDDGGSAAQCQGKAVHKAVELYLVPRADGKLLPPEQVPKLATADYPDAFPNLKEWRTKAVVQGVIRGLAERCAVLTPAKLGAEILVETSIQRAIPISPELACKLAARGYAGLEMLCIVDAVIQQGEKYLVWERKTTGSTRIGEDGLPYIDPEKVEAGRNSFQVAAECWSVSGLLNMPVTQAIYEIVGIAKSLKAEPNKPRLAFDYALVDYPVEAQGLMLDEARDIVEQWLYKQTIGRRCRNTGTCHNFNSTCAYWEICSAATGLRQDTINSFPRLDPKAREERHAKLKIHRVP